MQTMSSLPEVNGAVQHNTTIATASASNVATYSGGTQAAPSQVTNITPISGTIAGTGSQPGVRLVFPSSADGGAACGGVSVSPDRTTIPEKSDCGRDACADEGSDSSPIRLSRPNAWAHAALGGQVNWPRGTVTRGQNCAHD